MTKIAPILLCCISLFCGTQLMVAQKNDEPTTDTIPKIEKFGLRVGVDLAKPLRTLIEEGYSGFEIMGDFRVTKKFYAAVELGNEKKDWNEPYISSQTSGSYAKIGFDYNAYENWLGMENTITLGLRYGFSTFKQDLLSYRIYTDNPAFPTETINNSQEYSGLNAQWAEFILGIKTEIVNNLYLSLNVQLKRKISETEPENFANLYIPGFNRTYDYSEFGVGYGYSISYLIPIFKKSEASLPKEDN
ncbi:DUF6048 family protein [Aequorivita lipolytica]|uniref:DUF3575 domain-containing protein n=1 Tax=Aequorivita lipolytica TaxID=153267 RepID=A0A5C6YLU2_9FLAO|nr:DUF6048 family protein [Aequorivita lipolytica]TXD67972.1 hypothetical protein ESV24_14370 [Aequorivita lipolytica]SRX51504.1 hypothetical protein AEQU2_01987 [Aequorivita lipolytica]